MRTSRLPRLPSRARGGALPPRTGSAARRLALPLLLGGALAACGGAGGSSDGESGAETAAPAAASDVAPTAGAEGTVAFVDVHVVPMDADRVLEGRTVVVENGRIARVGPADEVDVPGDAAVVEGAGRYLMPGLGEMHAHVPPQGGREWMERVLFLYLSQGITTVRGMLGQPQHLELRADVASGAVLGPRIYTSGPSLHGGNIPDPDSARRAVRHQAAAGYDFLKIHPGLTRAAYDAMAETAREVSIRWAGHVPAAVGLERALEARQASIDHLDQYMEAIVEEGTDTSESLFFGVNLAGRVDESRIPEVARATAEAGVWNVPTQSLIENLLLPTPPERMAERPEMRYMPAETVRRWVEAKREMMQNELYSVELANRFVEVRRRLIEALHDAGAGLLLGSDAPQVFQVPGFSVHQELGILVESGLTPYEALRTGTANVADYFGAADEFGTVTEGMAADLVLVEGNPLDDVANASRIAGVMARGRWVPAERIRERLEAMARDRGD